MTKDDVDNLVEIKEKMKELIYDAKHILRSVDKLIYERAKYWIGQIECALDKEHDWLGGCSPLRTVSNLLTNITFVKF